MNNDYKIVLMKFNKKNIYHYFIYASYSLIFLIAYVISNFKNNKTDDIFLMGHSFNGNLEGFYKLYNSEYNIKYLTFNKEQTKSASFFCYYLNFVNVLKLLNSNLVVASHGILFHKLIKKRGIKTINIGHGVQTSIVNLSESELSQFDEVWVSSKFDQEILINKCAYKTPNLFTTGFLSHYFLLKNKNAVNKKPLSTKYILYAPTATSKLKKDRLSYFHLHNLNLLKKLNNFAFKHDYKIIIKPHIKDYKTKKFNKKTYDFISKSTNLVYFGDLEYPEDHFPIITDLLITDWSSIYLDFLILDKNIIFLNSPKRRKNLVLSEFLNNRFIKRCNTYDELESKLKYYIENANNKNFLHLKNLIFEGLNINEIDKEYRKRLKNLL